MFSRRGLVKGMVTVVLKSATEREIETRLCSIVPSDTHKKLSRKIIRVRIVIRSNRRHPKGDGRKGTGQKMS